MHVKIIKYKKLLWWSSTFRRQTRKISVVSHTVKGNVLDFQFGLMKITESQNGRGWKGPLWVI